MMPTSATKTEHIDSFARTFLWPAQTITPAPQWRRIFWLISILFTIFIAIWQFPPSAIFTNLHSYTPLHTILETFAVIVSAIVFAVGWHSYGPDRSVNALILACTFFAVAVLDLLHLLSYSGMPDFITPSSPEKAINYWLAARFAAALGLLTVVIPFGRASKIKSIAILWMSNAFVYVGVVFWLVSYHPEIIPRTFLPGSGLTNTKITAEWVLIAIMAVIASVIWQQRNNSKAHYDSSSLFAAVIVTILSELCFTLYSDVADAFNLLGHIYKVIAYALIYRAVFIVNVKAPYARLRESEIRYQRILESMPDAMISLDTNFRIVGFNPSAEQLFGYSANNVLGHKLDLVIPQYHALEQAIRNNQIFDARHATPDQPHLHIENGRHKNGAAIILDIAFAKFELYGQPVIVTMARDITAQKRAEDQLYQLNLELEQRVHTRTAELEASNKELEAFAYSVSHDLRTPLRAIDGYSRILMEDFITVLDGNAREFLRRICASTQRMDQLIDDLLALSRMTRIEMSIDKINLSQIAHEVIRQLRTSEPERQVEVHIAPDIDTFGDTRLLTVLLSNLLGNAWKYTGKTSQPRIEFGLKPDSHTYYVCDNGIGFDMQYVDKIFGAFQRLHSRDDFPGTGIGLATASRIVNRHGGRIWADAEINKGACFYFTLDSQNKQV